MHTVVGLFDTRAKARRAKGALIRAHIASPNIVLYDRSTADSSRESHQSLWESHKDALGFAEDRGFYEEGMGYCSFTMMMSSNRIRDFGRIPTRIWRS